jgi:(1->4)-alpha-D-glucan 1-alpha-D-glucosylmutase
MRARLDVLSEMTEEWSRRTARWHMYNRGSLGEVDGAAAPSLNDEYLLYQNIVGTWPMRIGSLFRSSEQRLDYVARLEAYALKASREAKVSTSWTMPNEPYEQALAAFIGKIFAEPAGNPFLASVMRFLPPVLRLGAINGIAQTVLKSTLPGVPDFYQGSEFWDLSMVDPDNRRPVDFAARARALDALSGMELAAALARWRDGSLKLFITQRLLALRNRLPDLFREGDYRPLAVAGPAKDHVVAFSRRWQNAEIVVLVCRLVARRLHGDRSALWPDGGSFLAETRIADVASRPWTDAFSGVATNSCARGLAVAEALSALPVAVLFAD